MVNYWKYLFGLGGTVLAGDAGIAFYHKYHSRAFIEQVHSKEIEAGVEFIGDENKLRDHLKYPFNANSRSVVAGKLAQVHWPNWPKRKFFNWYINKYGVNMDDAVEQDLDKYPTVSSFFLREIKLDEKRLVDQKSPLISPVDGKVLHCGILDSHEHLYQVKDMKFTSESFFGEGCLKEPAKGNSHFQCILYLAPGDYHHFHSPTEWNVTSRSHCSGLLFSVHPRIASWLQYLFVLNERVMYTGKWKYGFFSYTPVGATNVGSIVCPFDPTLKTNTDVFKPKNIGTFKTASFNDVSFKRADKFGHFNLGSTVVLVFEAPKNFKFTIKDGDRVMLGQGIGTL